MSSVIACRVRLLPVLLSLALAPLAAGQQRLTLPPGGSNWSPQDGPESLSTQDLTVVTTNQLARALLGDQVVATALSYVGTQSSAGLFTGGTGVIGFEEGLILSSGNIASVVGPMNMADDTSTDNQLPGDDDLDALLSGQTTFDATVLQFSFECVDPTTPTVSFQFVFASEEYNEFVFTQYNDIFAFFVNGENIALVPGTLLPVSIDTVNCGNPYNPPNGGNNCALFVNNSCVDLGLSFPCSGAVETELDGMTVLFTAQASIKSGLNSIKLAIADVGDSIYDSNIFIRGTSLGCNNPPGSPVFDPPTPCGHVLNARSGLETRFDVVALATNGQPGQEVTVTATGLPSGATFTPPLPWTGQPAQTTCSWVPAPSELGLHYNIVLTATDQLGASTDCLVGLAVEPGLPYCFGVGCPCGNDSPTAGCVNSTGLGAALGSSGSTSVAADDLVLTMTQGPANVFGLIYVGPNQESTPFGDGLRAVHPGPPTIGYYRFPLGMTGPTGVLVEGPGIVAYSAQFGGGPITAGSTWNFQGYYRDPLGPCGYHFNLSNGLNVVFTP